MTSYLTRPSPPKSATLFAVGKRMIGNDGKDYIVSETKAGVKRWVKVTSSSKAASPSKKAKKPLDMYTSTSAKAFYESQTDFKFMEAKFDLKEVKSKLKMVETRLKQIGIVFVNVPWKGIGNFIDDAHYYAAKKANDKSFILTTEHDLFWAERKEGKVYLGHEISDKKLFPLVDAIFIDVFKGRYVTKKMTGNKKLIVKLVK